MSQPDLKTWLARKPAGPKPRKALARRTRVRRVTPKRLDQLKEYWARVKTFLKEHPYCQIWLAEIGRTEEDAIKGKGFVTLTEKVDGGHTKAYILRVPRSREVHHGDKRRGSRLLNEAHWWAACAAMHRKVEENKAWAREKGYLLPF